MKKLLLSIALLASCANMMALDSLWSKHFADIDGPIIQENFSKSILITHDDQKALQKAQDFQQKCQDAGHPTGQLNELPEYRISIGGNFGPDALQSTETNIKQRAQ